MQKKLTIMLMMIFFFGVHSNIVSACTGFTASNENRVLVGNNEDLNLAYAEPEIRIYPPSSTNYGRVIFYCLWPDPSGNIMPTAFGGMNDQGLFFDIYSTPTLIPENSSHKPPINQDPFVYCMKKCVTIENVLEVFNSYNLNWMANIQGFFVDRTGNSVIIEGDNIILKSGNYQVVTNFLQSHPEQGWYPCWRYDTAVSMLENMEELSLEYFREICDAVHMENITSPDGSLIIDTIYSNICDLNEGIMYLYFYHNYKYYIEIDFENIFEDGYRVYDLASLFENNSNHIPNMPSTPYGPSSGKINEEQTYITSTTDVDSDQIFYIFDWGDGANSGWLGPYDSSEECDASHIWAEEGNYEIKVKAKDLYGAESNWSNPLAVSIPKYKLNDIIKPFLEKLIDCFSFPYYILNDFGANTI